MASLFGLTETEVYNPTGFNENILSDNVVSFGGNIEQGIVSTGLISQ